MSENENDNENKSENEEEKKMKSKKKLIKSTNSNTYLKNIYKVRNNLLKMLSDRGYEEWINKLYNNCNFSDFVIMYYKNDINLYIYKEKDDIKYQTIAIFINMYTNIVRVKANFEKYLVGLKKTFKDDHQITLIFIIEDNDGYINKGNIYKYLETFKKENVQITIETFLYSELSFNLIKNRYVPQHILLSEEEIKKVLEEYKCKRDDLPYILKDDPVSKYYSAKIGDVFKILRKSSTTGIAPPTYRIVI